MFDTRTPTANSDPAFRLAAVTKNDSTDLTAGGDAPRGLYVGGAGNVAVLAVNDSTPVTFVGVIAGSVLPVAAKKVMSTGTDATDIIAMY